MEQVSLPSSHGTGQALVLLGPRNRCIAKLAMFFFSKAFDSSKKKLSPINVIARRPDVSSITYGHVDSPKNWQPLI